MKNSTNWYLRGWEYHEVDGKKKLVYTGEYYTHGLSQRGLGRLKLAHGLLALILLVVFYAFASNGAPCGEVFYVGMPVLLTQIPLIYYLIGVVSFLFVKEKLTYRALRGSIMRIRVAAWIAASLLAVSLIGQIIWFLLSPPAGSGLQKALLYLAGTIVCTSILLLQLFLLRRFPAAVIPSGPPPLTPKQTEK